jgi:hypothetical protein
MTTFSVPVASDGRMMSELQYPLLTRKIPPRIAAIPSASSKIQANT